jgi:hypothetical protein
MHFLIGEVGPNFFLEPTTSKIPIIGEIIRRMEIMPYLSARLSNANGEYARSRQRALRRPDCLLDGVDDRLAREGLFDDLKDVKFFRSQGDLRWDIA